jgi:hypothetical protein
MTRDHQHNPDPNVNRGRIWAESIAAGLAVLMGFESGVFPLNTVAR